ncbi:MAG: peroxiredoxin-like family protein [Woeseiaceae bacterium]|nr:peroxiredoxin-like family protein [Woeseiaceae bacterium]
MTIGHKLVYGSLAAMFSIAFLCSPVSSVAAGDLDGIAASAEEVEPVQAGEMAPGFTVRTVDDELYVFDPENLDAPAVIVTFRGGWCPYCNMHLSELRHVVPQIADKGVDVLFLSGDRPELLYSSLKHETQEDIEGLGYMILSDADIEAARAFGLAFYADPDYVARRDAIGDIGGSSMKDFGVLPVPAVYVVDRSGMITFSFTEADYRVRLPADDLLAAASEVAD